MQARDVIEVVRLLESNDVDVWLDGGWGVDALVGEQTRPHLDLDVVVRLEHVERLRVILAETGFEFLHDWPDAPECFVLGDDRGRKLDVHPVTFNEKGEGIQRLTKGDWAYPAQGFTGMGVVDGRDVRCLTVEVQVLCHAGYELEDDDLHDLGALRDRLGARLLPHQRERVDGAE